MLLARMRLIRHSSLVDHELPKFQNFMPQAPHFQNGVPMGRQNRRRQAEVPFTVVAGLWQSWHAPQLPSLYPFSPMDFAAYSWWVPIDPVWSQPQPPVCPFPAIHGCSWLDWGTRSQVVWVRVTNTPCCFTFSHLTLDMAPIDLVAPVWIRHVSK